MDVGRHPNITILTLSEVKELQGEAGNFKAKILQHTRNVDVNKCTGCGDCWNDCLVFNRPEIREMPSIKEKLEPSMLRKLDEIIDINECRRENIIGILQDITEEYNWLPKDAIYYVAEKLEIPFSYVYRIASFFTQFSLKPRGKHIITVCLGTACYTRGGEDIANEISRILEINLGETTPDMKFTLEGVNCLGCCAIGPIAVIDGKYFGDMTRRKVNSLLAKYK